MEAMDKSTELSTTLEKLNDSIHTGEKLISTLLEIARFDQGALVPKMSAQHLQKILHSLANEFDSVAQHKQLRFKVIGDTDVWIKTDAVYLHRILRNLISNAIKYTHSGTVLVCVRQRKAGCLVQVRDSGEGISERDQHKIFEDFYRAHEGHEQGVGLGLAVVARLSKLLGLSVNIQSRLQQGSCFSLLLPTTDPILSHNHMPPKKPRTIAGLTALCVDDEHTNLDAMATLLTKWQVSTLTAHSADDALKQATEHSPDVLLVDYQLGEQSNGIDFIQSARKALHKDIPAVLITALRDEALVEQANELMIHYLPKPVKPAKLRALLTSFKLSPG